MTISVVVPVCNELENIPLLHQQLAAVLPSLSRLGRGAWEVTAAAPLYFEGYRDLRPTRLSPLADAA